MLLTITTTHQPATDLGFLLHKHPGRVHQIKVSFGTARVLFPYASDHRCTAALLLEQPLRLHDLRLSAVADELGRLGARTVIDLGCGEGKLIERLIRCGQYERIVGLDASVRALGIAHRRLRLADATPKLRDRVELLHGGLTYRDPRMDGFDAAALVEVVEHLDPPRLAVAIVLHLDLGLCEKRNRGRVDRNFGPHVLRNQASQLRQSLRSLRREGFRHVYVLSSPEEIDGAVVERMRMRTDRRDEHGPFDLIGDVHGCWDELLELLGKLGWVLEIAHDPEDGPRFQLTHQQGRKLVFLGDLVDRGPAVPRVLRLAMDAVAAGAALCVPWSWSAATPRRPRRASAWTQARAASATPARAGPSLPTRGSSRSCWRESAMPQA